MNTLLRSFSQQAVLDLAAFQVTGGVVVTNLGVDGVAFVKELIDIASLQQAHVLVKVALHIADAGQIAVKLISLNIQQAQVAGQDIALKIDQTAHRCIADKLDQAFALWLPDQEGCCCAQLCADAGYRCGGEQLR